ncbi:MAG TPA: AAA family ATPase, partial [Kineosporiaceae bacterium]|nr:AAA family ATPase [Kineosporiaceae bacterium]
MVEGVASVPAPSSPMIGRTLELEQARALLQETRLVSITGTGGVGKTRLAVEVAADPGGLALPVMFVDLAVLDNPEQVLPAIARAIGLKDGGSPDLSVRVHRQLNETPALLLLDNVEQLLPAAGATVAHLLAQCPATRVLATSRAPLQVPGEHLLPVEPLPVPDLRALPPAADLVTVPAIALLVARVQAVLPGFDLTAANARTVAEIAAALEGLPLALELVAPQVRALGLAAVLSRVRDRFKLLDLPNRQVADRHRSLAGAVSWSLKLLTPQARRVFSQLSVFVGG